MWIWIAAWAQDGDGRLPGAIPIRREDLPPPAEAPAPAPAPAVDHSKIKVVHHETGPVDAPSPVLGALAIGVAVFGAVGGAALFASRLVVAEESSREDGPNAS